MTPPPWQAERVVAPAEARALIEDQFPEFRPAQVRNFAQESWDNTTYLVNGSHVFRFPRREFAANLVDTEAKILPGVAKSVSLAVPDPRWVGRPTETYSWIFAGYSILPGQTACSASLHHDQRHSLAAPLGRFLRELHSIPLPIAEGWGARPDGIRRLDVGYRNPGTIKRLQDMEEKGLIGNAASYVAVLEERENLQTNGPIVLLHGDLYSRHLLLVNDAGPTVSGVIDWGDVHLGHPAVDLSIAHLFLPPESHQCFRSAYGSIDEDTWELARIRSIWHSCAVAPFAVEQGDSDLSREAFFALRNALPN